jgi:hydrogenase maturation protease
MIAMPMQIHPPNPLKIIGVGNAWRSDDAAGLCVIQRLRSAPLPGVILAETPGTAASILAAWEDTADAIVVDAVLSGAPPGTIYRLDAHDSAAAFPVSRSTSSHGWGLAEALALGQVFRNLPSRLIIYGIEGQDFSFGESLSPAIAAALPEVVRRITAEIAVWRNPIPSALNACQTGGQSL